MRLYSLHRILCFAPLVLFYLTNPVFAQVTFTNVTNAAGVAYNQQVSLDTYCIPPVTFENFMECGHRTMTGAIAIGDYDNDGLDDIYATRMSDTDILFRNNGDGTYNDVSTQAGFTQVLNTNGANWSDVDNDGDLDLFVSTVNETRYYFYVNNGDGTFSEDAIARGLALDDGEAHAGWSITTGDYDHDGFPDIFIGEWSNFSSTIEHSKLFHNRGLQAPGYFEDKTAAAGIVANNGASEAYNFAPAFVDLDQDGWVDLTLAADFGNSQLYWNNGDGTFTDGGGTAGIGTDENGMGSTFGDINGDGFLDWFVTSIYDTSCADPCSWGVTGNRLYLYNGSRSFTDGTDALGVRDGAWGWGASMFDHNNDTYLDIVMTNGFVNISSTEDDIWNNDVSRFFRNNGNGTMSEVGATVGITDNQSGKGLVTFDYDDDGDLDIMIANAAGPSILYANQGGNAAGDWLRVKFTAAGRPFEGLNAKIRLQSIDAGPIQISEMGVATHFLGQSERVAHFGLGTPSATPIHEITVEWPLTGQVQTFNNVARNQTFVITAPSGEVVDPPHDADTSGDFSINLSELLRIIQFFNCGEYHIDALGQDGFNCGSGAQSGVHHSADYNVPDWKITLAELLRVIQFFNFTTYHRSYTGEDGYVPGS